MGAFWHLFSPVTVSVTINKHEFEAIPDNQSILPEPFAKNFFEVNRSEWSDESRILGTRHKINLTYMLSDESLNQIKPFLNEAWHLIESENPSLIPKGLKDFIKNSLTPLSISGTSFEKIDKQLRDIGDNYYLHYASIPSTVVYHGWPDELHSKSRNYSMGGFIFLHSHEKMNAIPEETVLFYNLKDKIKRQLSGRYIMAEYVYTLGF